MKHRVRVTVIDKKLYPELQRQYCTDPCAGACPCYNVGDEFLFCRDEERDDFWHMGLNTLVKTTADPDTVAGGPRLPHCSELVGRRFPIYLYRTAGRFHHEGLDEGGKHHDCLLLRRYETGHIQNRAN